MEIRSLLKNCAIERVKLNQAAGTTTITSDAVDMQGYSGCLFVAAFGAIVSGNVTVMKAQQSADDAAADAYADLVGTALPNIGTADADLLGALEIYEPNERYLKCVITRTTQNAELDSLIAIKFGAKKVPVSQSSSHVAQSESHVEPAEGTA